MLEVIALSVEDVKAAKAGGADRVELVGTMADDGLSPTLDLVKEIQDSVDLPLRVMLRTEAGFGTSDCAGLVKLAGGFSELDVNGIVLGYLKDGQIDTELMAELLSHIRTEYTFHRAIDYAADYDSAFTAVDDLGAKLTSILTSGSPAGVSENMERLAHYAEQYSHLMLIGGGLKEEHVPQLKEAGLRNFHVGSRVRPDGDFSQPIDPRLVEAWKKLTD